MRNFLRVIGELLLDIFETVVIALSIFVITYLFAFQPHEVNGQSMDGIDNFHDGQYILTDKVTYKFKEPKRGDVIVFKYPLNKSYDYIKRVIGLPGETITLKNNKVIVFNAENPEGFVLNESEYIGNDVMTKGRKFLTEGQKIIIPDDSYFVMGDNRQESSDSRTWGLVTKEDIIGKSFFRYWPPNEVGTISKPSY